MKRQALMPDVPKMSVGAFFQLLPMVGAVTKHQQLKMTKRSIIRLFLLIAILCIGPLVNAQSKYEISYTTPLSDKDGNSVFKNTSDSIEFIDRLYQALVSGAVKAYDPKSKEDRLLTTEQIRQRLERTDTVTMIDPTTKKQEVRMVTVQRTIRSIKSDEEWILDKAGHLSKRVKSYLVLIANFDAQGSYHGDEYVVKIKNDGK